MVEFEIVEKEIGYVVEIEEIVSMFKTPPSTGIGLTALTDMFKYHDHEALPESIEFYTNDSGKVKQAELETILYIPIVSPVGEI